MRGGKLTDNRFGNRMRGSGVYWNAISGLFEMTRSRLGLGSLGDACSINPYDKAPGPSTPPKTQTAGQFSFDF